MFITVNSLLNSTRIISDINLYIKTHVKIYKSRFGTANVLKLPTAKSFYL